VAKGGSVVDQKGAAFEADMSIEKIKIPHVETKELAEFFISLLNEQSERAMIIIGAAKIEALVKDVVRKILPKMREGTIYKGIETLSQMGLIDVDTTRCLHCLREIRNHYAHKPNQCSLDDIEVKERTIEITGILERTCDIEKRLKELNASLQTKLDAIVGPGHEVKKWVSDRSERIRHGILFIGLQLLAAKTKAPTPQQPIPLGRFIGESV
jgi:Domain of unknown function (DUF4145)